MHPVLFDFGFFKLHTYGLMMATAFMVGMQLAVRDARRIDLSPKRNFDQFILDLSFWLLIAGLVGSRIVFIMVNWEQDYSKDPLKMFRVWEGGLVFYGGLIGAVLFSVTYCMRKKQSFLLIADTIIPTVALGQFFGRIGCFAAGCCWGIPSSESYFGAVQFPAGSLAHSSMRHTGQIAADALHTVHIHPVQLYESTGALLIFFILQWMRTKKRFHGQQLLTYMFLYPLLRSTLELFRGDRERGVYKVIGDLEMSTSQLISVGFACTAVTLLLVLIRRRAQESVSA
jgi:phosphatidylglycerol:prolipoprotein diacylglycerol transferase